MINACTMIPSWADRCTSYKCWAHSSKTTKVWESKGENESAKSGWRIQSCCYLKYIHTRKFIHSCPWISGEGVILDRSVYSDCVFAHVCKKEGFISAEGEAIFLYSPLTLWGKVRRQILHTYKSGWTLRGMSNGALLNPKLLWQCPRCMGLS